MNIQFPFCAAITESLYIRILGPLACLICALLVGACQSVETPVKVAARNPLIWADVPDPAVIRVGDTYYMSSTTMHMNPGLPIMKSQDLVNWELVGYVYDTLSDDEASRLDNGKQVYGRGSWASSLRYHEGRYYVTTFANTTRKTYIFSTDDIEKGQWQRAELDELFHDASLVFDNNRVFLLYGNDDIHLVELTADASAIKADGVRSTLIKKASAIAGTEFWVPAEGAQMLKVGNHYYLNLISWPAGGMRTQLIYRADNFFGPYEGRIAFADRGIAQGGLIDTPAGDWYAFLFQDHGAVGRIPYLVPVYWQDSWPIYGDLNEEGKRQAPHELPISVTHQGLNNLVATDEFNYAVNEPLKLAWQWNHNPVNAGWSLVERPGHLRLTNQRIDTRFVDTQNTLTQRTFGPTSSARTLIDTSRMKPGDYAGLGALQANYGFVGVERSGEASALVMAKGTPESWQVIERIPLAQPQVHLRIDMDFRERADIASFWYSLNGNDWLPIGESLAMKYTLPHFMGYRFALFNFATQHAGGSVDFDFYRITE